MQKFINRSKHKACISSVPQSNGNSIEFSLSTWTRSSSKASWPKFLHQSNEEPYRVLLEHPSRVITKDIHYLSITSKLTRRTQWSSCSILYTTYTFTIWSVYYFSHTYHVISSCDITRLCDILPMTYHVVLSYTLSCVVSSNKKRKEK